MSPPKKILIAPLDWGLGHTTRCIPLIRYLLRKGCEVVLAAEGDAAQLLRENFPNLPILNLKGYRIHYSKNKKQFTGTILSQIPKILRTIREEKIWLQHQHSIHHFDAVISDNRYGLHHKALPSVILTHQLQIQSGKGAAIDRWLRKLHYRMLQRFTQCWIVDMPGKDNLSGILAHPEKLPKAAVYIGLLSQMIPPEGFIKKNGTILVLLSGPEPARTQLLSVLLQQAITMSSYEFLFVAGNPSGKVISDLPAHIRYHTHLNADQLSAALAAAALVICRSGYSTLMDLCTMEQKALLIPTPGQTEQEYLARYLHSREIALTVEQDAIQLSNDIPAALSKKGFANLIPEGANLMFKAVDALLEKLR